MTRFAKARAASVDCVHEGAYQPATPDKLRHDSAPGLTGGARYEYRLRDVFLSDGSTATRW